MGSFLALEETQAPKLRKRGEGTAYREKRERNVNSLKRNRRIRERNNTLL